MNFCELKTNFREPKTFTKLCNYLLTKFSTVMHLGKTFTSYKQGQRAQKDN